MIGPQISGNNWGEDSSNQWMPDLSKRLTFDYVMKLLAKHIRGKLTYLPGRGFFYFNGLLWLRDVGSIHVKRFLREVPRLLRLEAKQWELDQDLEHQFLEAIREFRSVKFRRAAQTWLSISDLDLDIDFSARHPERLNLQNGIYDSVNDKLYPHNSAEHWLQIANASFAPEAKCPNWDQFIRCICGGNTEKMEFLQRLTGAALFCEDGYQLFFQSDASTFRTLAKGLNDVFGDFGGFVATERIFKTRGRPPGFSDILRNRRLVFSAALKPQIRKHWDLFSKLDAALTEIPHQPSNGPIPSLWILLGKGLQINTSNEHFWEQALVFSLEKQDPDTLDLFEKRFHGESSGILNWAINGFHKFQISGTKALPGMDALKDEIRRGIDPIWYYCNRICLRVPGLRTGSTPLYKHYRIWCQANGYIAVTHKAFSSKAQTYLGETQKDKLGNMYFDGFVLPDTLTEIPNPEHRSIFERAWLKMDPEVYEEDDDGIEARARALADEENEAWDEQEEEGI